MKKIKLSLSYKLTIPVVLLVSFIVIINLFSKRQTLYSNANSNAITTADNLTRLMNSKVDAASHKALMTASVCSESSSVKWAYSVFNQTGNLDSASLLIQRNIQPIIKTVKSVTGIEPKIHFHLPPARSFIRCWTDKRGDDLSSFRNTILEISTTHKAIRGIEVGLGGFAVRGISPIFDIKKKYLGSVEVLFPFNNILKKIVNTETEDYAIYIKQDQLAIATKLNKSTRSIEKSEEIVEDYVLIQNSDNYKKEFLNNVDFIFSNNKPKNIIADNYIYSLVPIQDFEGKNVGLVSIQIDISKRIVESQATVLKYAMFGFFILIIVSIILILLITNIVSKPIKKLAKNIQEISKGKLIDQIESKSIDEIGVIYSAFNTLLTRLKISTNFANEIGKGNLDVKIDDAGKDDVLSLSLISMKNNLVEARDTESQRQLEEVKRNWTTNGMAKFGDVMRQNSNDISKLSDEIIKNLVHYLDANQGGIFIINDDDTDNITLDLLASYAFERKKFKQKQIHLGEGLVGTCAIEKQTIHIADVPNDYINITSGLGGANPRNILIVPLKIEDDVYGVVELASFKEIEDYKIDFVEKVGESIASTLSSVKVNQRTAILLEQSQQQSEELAAQEEEMRQNLEEMQATQEEASRRETEMTGILGALNSSSLVVEFDLSGNIININDETLKTFNLSSKDEIIGKTHKDLYSINNAEIDSLWQKLQLKQTVSRKSEVSLTNGQSVWLNETYSPVLDVDGDLIKVLNISFDITEEVIKEQKVAQQTEEMMTQEEEMRQNLEEMQASQENLEISMKEAAVAAYNVDKLSTPILNIDTEYNVTYINEIGTKIAEVSYKDAIGKKCYDLFTNPHCQTNECRIYQAMKNNKLETGKTIVKGTSYAYTGHPLYDENGNINGALEQMTDISSFEKKTNKDLEDSLSIIEKTKNKLKKK